MPLNWTAPVTDELIVLRPAVVPPSWMFSVPVAILREIAVDCQNGRYRCCPDRSRPR